MTVQKTKGPNDSEILPNVLMSTKRGPGRRGPTFRALAAIVQSWPYHKELIPFVMPARSSKYVARLITIMKSEPHVADDGSEHHFSRSCLTLPFALPKAVQVLVDHHLVHGKSRLESLSTILIFLDNQLTLFRPKFEF